MAEEKGTSLFYFLVGAAVGAAAGVLIAPRSGEETREQLSDWIKQRRQKGTDLLHKVKEESLVKSEALIAAAKAAKDAYAEASSRHHPRDGTSAS